MALIKTRARGLKLDDTFAFTGTVSGAGGGITVADQWRLTSSYSGSTDPISANLERVDSASQGTIGSAMSVSSGLWTFPSTGVYLVRMIAGFYLHNNADRSFGISIYATTNNSSYSEVATSSTNLFDSDDNTSTTVVAETYIDVTNTTNVKVKFTSFHGHSSGTANTSSTVNKFTFTFIRLGDT